MTPEQKAAYINARIIRAQIIAMGMVAANKERERHDYGPAYDEASFFNLIDVEGIGENDIIKFFQE